MISTAHDSDLPLLKGLMEGDNTAINEIYDCCYNQVRIMIHDNSGSSDDAKDVFQDAILAVYRRLHEGDFNLTCKLSSYLQVICRNLWRSRNRRTPMVSLSVLVGKETVDLDDNVIEQMISSDKRNLLYKHFETLEKGCKRILEMFFRKVPMAQIAKEIDSTEAYVKKRKFVCKSRLVDLIKADPLFKELQNG